ncbi:C2H2 finger domain protein [Apiospora saccharicola]
MASNNVIPFSAANLAGHTAQAATQSQTPSHPCPRPGCVDTFASAADLYQHQYRKSHWTCSKCEINFYDGTSLQKHDAKWHVPEEELVCPGCKSTFRLPSGLMKHVEFEQCPTIKPAMVNEARKRRVDFVKGLGSMNPANEDNLFRYMDDKTVNADIRPWCQPDRAHHNFVEWEDDYDFELVREPETPKNEPDLYLGGVNKAPDLLTGDNLAALDRALEERDTESKACPWSSNEDKVRPTPKQLLSDLEHEYHDVPVDMTKRIDHRVIDPDKQGYNPAVFYQPFFERYKCPHLRCGKKFVRPERLTSHLKSPEHKAGMRISCPYCSRLFATMTDAIGHAQSTSSKCQIRGSDLFREFIANVSGGLIDVFMTKPDGIAFHVPRYMVPPNILAEFVPGLRPKADEQPTTPTRHHSGGGSIDEQPVTPTRYHRSDRSISPMSAARVIPGGGSRADCW